MSKLTAQAFGVIDKDGTLWPAAAATQEGMYMTIAEIFGIDAAKLTKNLKSSGYRVVPVIITEA